MQASAEAINNLGNNIFNISLDQFINSLVGKKKKKGGMLSNLPDMPPEQEEAVKKHFNDLLKNNDVVIFSTTTCPWCTVSEETLQKNNIQYKKINYNNYLAYEGDHMVIGPLMYKYALEYTGLKTVPNIIVKEKSIGGNTALH